MTAARADMNSTAIAPVVAPEGAGLAVLGLW